MKLIINYNNNNNNLKLHKKKQKQKYQIKNHTNFLIKNNQLNIKTLKNNKFQKNNNV